jgi:hypothetical protein
MFGDDEEQIKAAVINHTLQIAFTAGSFRLTTNKNAV